MSAPWINRTDQYTDITPNSDQHVVANRYYQPHFYIYIHRNTYEPALVILGGVEAFIRGGPARGDLVSPGVILVGTDRVAIDALGAAVLKMYKRNLPKISKAPHLRNAIQLGLGVDCPEKIHIITDDEESTRFSQRLHKYAMDNWA